MPFPSEHQRHMLDHDCQAQIENQSLVDAQVSAAEEEGQEISSSSLSPLNISSSSSPSNNSLSSYSSLPSPPLSSSFSLYSAPSSSRSLSPSSSSSSCSFHFSYPPTSSSSSPSPPSSPSSSLPSCPSSSISSTGSPSPPPAPSPSPSPSHSYSSSSFSLPSSSSYFTFSSSSSSSSSFPVNLTPPEEEELSPPQNSETAFSFMTMSTSDENSKDTEDEGSPSTPASVQSLPREPPEEEVTAIVRFLLIKYRMGQLTTKLEMLDVVSSNFKNEFPIIFQRASQNLKMVFGIDLQEVHSILGTYALENSLGLTYNRVLIDDEVMPQNGVLVLILGVILLEGNSASEEVIWEFLKKLSVHAGKEGVLHGERRELITKDWVQDQYLEYCQVPDSDPVLYEFRWGPRAHAETNRINVLEFFTMVNGNDLSSYPPWYEEALREVGERAPARIASTDTATVPVPAGSPAPSKD